MEGERLIHAVLARAMVRAFQREADHLGIRSHVLAIILPPGMARYCPSAIACCTSLPPLDRNEPWTDRLSERALPDWADY